MDRIRGFKKAGFTLAELLIALAILGVIATFTIPKVLQSQQSSQYSSEAKEVAGMLSGAFQAYQQANGSVVNATAGNLTPYMNYVSYTTSATMDYYYTGTTEDCSLGASYGCLRLHNGGILLAACTIPNASTTNAFSFDFDPDGKITDGTTNGPGKSVQFWLYEDGRLTTRSSLRTGSYCGSGTYASVSTADPPWFSWN